MTSKGTRARCQHVKANGEQCLSFALPGSQYCFWHDPARAADRAAARKKGGENRRRTVRHLPGEPAPIALQTPGDVLQALEDELNTIAALEPSLARARTIGYLLGFALKALEVAELAARVEALETATFGPQGR